MKQLIVLFALIAFVGGVSAEESGAGDGAARAPEAASVSVDSAAVDSAESESAGSASAGENDAEREALVALKKMQLAAWKAAVVERLVERDVADDLAIAGFLAHISSMSAEETCDAHQKCAGNTVIDDGPGSLHGLLADSALERGDELDPVLLYGLVSPRFHRLEPEKQGALADRLIELSPHRLSSWSTKLDALQKQSADPEEITAIINQASQSVSDYRDPAYETTRRIDAALALVPMPAELKASTLAVDRFNDCGMGCLGVEDEPTLRMIHAFGYGMAVALPSYAPLFDACDPDGLHIDARRPGCRQIARSLATNGENLLDEMMGLGILQRLVEGSPEEAAVIAARRRYYWQQEMGAQMHMDAFGDVWGLGAPNPDAIRRWAAAIREDGSSELSVLRDYLRETGVPLDPPASWMPMNPDVLKARR